MSKTVILVSFLRAVISTRYLTIWQEKNWLALIETIRPDKSGKIMITDN